MNNDFKSNFDKKRKFIRRVMLGMFITVILIAITQFGLIYFGYVKIEENGGFRVIVGGLIEEVKKYL